MTDDKDLKREGKVDTAAGSTKENVKSASDKAKDKLDDAADKVKDLLHRN